MVCGLLGFNTLVDASPGIPQTAPDSLIELPDGFQAYVVAEGLKARGRHIAVRDNGNLYISLRRGGGHQFMGGAAALSDEDGDGLYEKVEYFGEHEGTGIHIHNGYLYRSTTRQILRHKLHDNVLLPGAAEVIVDNLPEQNSHAARPLAFDNRGNMYVNIGVPSNACMEQRRTKGSPGQRPCPELENHGGIWRFDASKTGQDARSDGKRYTTGHRHMVAIEWNDGVDELFGVMHGRDQLNQLFPELYSEKESAELPSEEFHVMPEGSNLGWPYTYWDHLEGVRRIAPEYGGDSVAIDRSGIYQEPILGFPGHWAPNDIIFYDHEQFPRRYRNGAFIVFHGSWNRAPLPQEGYNVVFVPMRNGRPAGEYEIFADGFKGKEILSSPGDAVYRPCGAAIANDGSLYIVDSREGRLWKIVYTGRESIALTNP